jgi:hypothetical protein
MQRPAESVYPLHGASPFCLGAEMSAQAEATMEAITRARRARGRRFIGAVSVN